jgi:hypothetical protein
LQNDGVEGSRGVDGGFPLELVLGMLERIHAVPIVSFTDGCERRAAKLLPRNRFLLRLLANKLIWHRDWFLALRVLTEMVLDLGSLWDDLLDS